MRKEAPYQGLHIPKAYSNPAIGSPAPRHAYPQGLLKLKIASIIEHLLNPYHIHVQEEDQH
eukprot:1161809-Pelagomonas_calceolata.AAC.11